MEFELAIRASVPLRGAGLRSLCAFVTACALLACHSRPPGGQTRTTRATNAAVPLPPPIARSDVESTWHPEVPDRCHSRHLGVPSEHALRACPATIVDGTTRWHPDSLVVLGGGILGPGQPGCATVQRAFAAHQLFEALGREPWLLLTGRGPVEAARPVDSVEADCVAARLRSELDSPLEPIAREAVLRDTQVLAQTRSVELTEADYMCAGILAFYPPEERAGVLSRMIFEPRSTSTLENASYSTAILRTRHIERALIVSTPVLYADHRVDNHPARAIEDFRRDRERGVHATRLGAVGCPYAEGGPEWSEFE